MYTLTKEGKSKVFNTLMMHGNMSVISAINDKAILQQLFEYVEQQTKSGKYQLGRWRLGSRYTRTGYAISISLGADSFTKKGGES